MILNIDTSAETASISLASEGRVIGSSVNPTQKDHASWLHPAIEQLLEKAATGLHDLNAIAVTSGPGSYTGLRVGMAAAKGFCFALGVPMILEPTLKTMAFAMKQSEFFGPEMFVCPMIDARRMEVFTAVYDAGLKELLPPAAIILDKNSFEDMLSDHRMLFAGSGVEKWKQIQPSSHAIFVSDLSITEALAVCSYTSFVNADFADISQSEPVYLKEFYTHGKK